MGYPGGIFDPLGFSKANLKELQTKEIKNGRIAMIAFMAFVIQVRKCAVPPSCQPAVHSQRPVVTTAPTCKSGL